MPLSRALTATALLLLTTTLAYGALYKWVDEKGRVQYSDKPPPDKGGVEMSNRGIVVKKLEPGLTPEQRKAKDEEAARRKLEEQKAAEQRRQDSALLQSFTSVQEIDMKRDREIQALEAMIANLRNQERATDLRMLEERKRADYYAQRGKPPPDGIKEDLARSEAEKKTLAGEIVRRQQEVTATRVKYDALKKRYIELREQGQAIAPAAAAAPKK